MCSVVKKGVPAPGPGVFCALCSVGERGMLLQEVHEKHITCNMWQEGVGLGQRR